MKVRFDRRRPISAGFPPAPLFALAGTLLLTAVPPLVGRAGTEPPFAPPARVAAELPLPPAPAPGATAPLPPGSALEPAAGAPTVPAPRSEPAPVAQKRPPAAKPKPRRPAPPVAAAARPSLPAIAESVAPSPGLPSGTPATASAGDGEAPAAQVATAALRFPHPLSVAKLTSRFGSRRNPVSGRRSHHEGIDLAAPRGTPVLAPSAARVYLATPRYGDGRHGRTVVLDHGDGVRTLYAHLDRIHVETGDEVAAGQVIGTVGTTGRTTGPHLHFEVHVGGRAVDPLPTLVPRGGEVRIVETPAVEAVLAATVAAPEAAPAATDAAVPAAVEPPAAESSAAGPVE